MKQLWNIMANLISILFKRKIKDSFIEGCVQRSNYFTLWLILKRYDNLVRQKVLENLCNEEVSHTLLLNRLYSITQNDFLENAILALTVLESSKIHVNSKKFEKSRKILEDKIRRKDNRRAFFEAFDITNESIVKNKGMPTLELVRKQLSKPNAMWY